MTPISLDEYEEAKWDFVVDGPWYTEVPGLGALREGQSYFRDEITLLDAWESQWARYYVSMDLLEGTRVEWWLMIPSCQEP